MDLLIQLGKQIMKTTNVLSGECVEDGSGSGGGESRCRETSLKAALKSKQEMTVAQPAVLAMG